MFDSANQADAVVSYESEELILVNEADDEVGFASKSECHDGQGLLHRAFSILVFNSAGELLLQRRSKEKRLWGNYWSNSCCSHPRRGESMATATSRRLREELGLSAKLRYLYKFSYAVPFENLGSERELCYVYAGVSDELPTVNANEIDAWRFVGADQLDRELEQTPEQFTPWFMQEWQVIKTEYPQYLVPQKTQVAAKSKPITAPSRR